MFIFLFDANKKFVKKNEYIKTSILFDIFPISVMCVYDALHLNIVSEIFIKDHKKIMNN